MLSVKTNVEIDKDESRYAFHYLNQFRANPKEMGKKIKLNLNGVDSKDSLIWNDTLASIAEERAKDLALNNYFAHVNKKGEAVNIMLYRAGYNMPKDLYKDKKLNCFESLQAGSESGIDVINSLIIDEGIKSKGHRKHLLGISDGKYSLNPHLKDVGIAFVRVKEGKTRFHTYTCVIIAAHNFPFFN